MSLSKNRCVIGKFVRHKSIEMFDLQEGVDTYILDFLNFGRYYVISLWKIKTWFVTIRMKRIHNNVDYFFPVYADKY